MNCMFRGYCENRQTDLCSFCENNKDVENPQGDWYEEEIETCTECGEESIYDEGMCYDCYQDYLDECGGDDEEEN